MQAAAWLAAQCSCGLLVLLHLPPAAIALGVASVLPVMLYPLAKRFVKWPQVKCTALHVCRLPVGEMVSGDSGSDIQLGRAHGRRGGHWRCSLGDCAAAVRGLRLLDHGLRHGVCASGQGSTGQRPHFGFGLTLHIRTLLTTVSCSSTAPPSRGAAAASATWQHSASRRRAVLQQQVRVSLRHCVVPSQQHASCSSGAAAGLAWPYFACTAAGSAYMCAAAAAAASSA